MANFSILGFRSFRLINRTTLKITPKLWELVFFENSVEEFVMRWIFNYYRCILCRWCKILQFSHRWLHLKLLKCKAKINETIAKESTWKCTLIDDFIVFCILLTVNRFLRFCIPINLLWNDWKLTTEVKDRF